MNVRKWFLFMPVIALCLGSLRAAPQDERYVLGPDSKAKDGVPRGQVVPMSPFHSTIYADAARQWWLYVPAQYDPAKPACVMVFQDGGSSTGDPKQAGPWNATYVFDNLIAAGQMPVTIGVFISPGELPPKEPGGKPVSNRSVEYDTPDGTYGRFLLEEILPEVAKKYTLTDKPEERAICGSSSGGICAFKVAWERPDAFQKVVSHIGSFTNIRGGYSLSLAHPQDRGESRRGRLHHARTEEPARPPPQDPCVLCRTGGTTSTTSSATGRWQTRRWRRPSSSRAGITSSSLAKARTTATTVPRSFQTPCAGCGGIRNNRL